MGLLASLFAGPTLTALINGLMGPLESIFHDYIQNKITKEELQEKLQEAMLAAFAQIEVQFLDSLTKTYTAFIQAASQNPVMTKAWSVVLYSQLFVVFWHQFAIPLIVLVVHIWDVRFIYPSSGITSDWAYALIALCLGAPQIASRVGAGASWAANNLSKIVKS